MSQTKRWKLFQDHLGSTTNDTESNDVSFTFTCDDKNDETLVKANRGLLSLLSPVFKSMFNNGMKESLDNTILIKDSDSKSFQLFIQYFYAMDPEITPTNIGSLSYLAEKYLVVGLQKSCALFLAESISINNLIPTLESLHKHHQNKLFENCKIWMGKQSSIDGVIKMFKSDAFMNNNSEIINVLLSGFGGHSKIDASVLWQCVIKWSEIKGNEVIVKGDGNDDGNDDDEKEEKEDKKIDDNETNNEIPKPKYNKLRSIREHFPFYRLEIDIICDEVLPLKILNKDMALEVLTHKSYGKYRTLSQYCMSHKSLYYPKKYFSTEMECDFEFTNKQHVVFKAFRSNSAKNTYLPRWTKEILSSDERKEDDGKYFRVNAANDSEIEFLTTGWYRVTFRTCTYYSSHGYSQLRINGSCVANADNYGTSSNNYKSYNFNEIMQICATQKLSFYVYPAPYAEEQSSYLCIEKIPDKILRGIGIWKSSSTSSYYRQWNNAIKTCDRYNLSNSNKNINIQKGGLYRVSSRIHTNHSSSGQQHMQLYEYRNGGQHQHRSAKAAATSGYQLHMFDEICSLKKADYLTMYDGSYGTISNAKYDCIQMEYLPFTDRFGVWKSATVVSTYQRAWDHEYWNNDMLYSLNNTKNIIEVKQNGYYRISSHVTQQTSSNQAGYSALYINNSQYCLARYGAYGSTYQHTTTIQEIVKLKKGDKFYISVSPTPYNSRDFNSLYIEKLY